MLPTFERLVTMPSVPRNADWKDVTGTLELPARSQNRSVKTASARRYVAGFLAVLTGVFILGVSPAAAATAWYVDGTFGNDGNSCTAPTLVACKTIQAAINKASPNDTINVAVGTYPEPAAGPLTVNKTLTLLGAQNGVDARGRVGAESIVTDSQGTFVTANNVVIDGFTVQNSTNPAFTGYGIAMGAGTTGTQILNNIIQNNIVGIALANSGGSQVLIRHNQIQGNNQPGSASGTGIYTDQFVSGGKVKNVLIEENAFVGNNDAGIDVSNTDAANGVSSLEVSTNSFDANGRAVLLFNTHMSTVHNNSITNSTFVGSAAIRLFDNNSDLSIMHNDLMTGVGHAIRLSFLGFVGGSSSNVVINENNIGFVGPVSFVLDGLKVDSGSYNGTVNAECNWWGSATGPTNANNPGGTGEEVEGSADFTPWLIAPAPGGSCGITPGKATGGGQVESDPVFSPLGDLLSLPALIPSLSGPTAQATFGFVAKCCAATGNLEYNDHSMDVRIKAQSIDGLNISSPGVSCPATPGSKHAQIAGTAAVIRPTGTTTEPFTVDVDDCGEPGTADTFGIKTTTYANGPNVLIGGNIQIH
jgi:parallel beta-helix repeat protein